MGIQNRHTSFSQLTYTMTALPVVPFLKLQGIASEGISWEEIQTSKIDKGADGQAYKVYTPVIYRGTLHLQANSPSRIYLDMLVDGSKAGELGFLDYDLVLTEKNETTGYKRVYSGGTIARSSGGNNATRDDGQQAVVYVLEFSSRTPLPNL